MDFPNLIAISDPLVTRTSVKRCSRLRIKVAAAISTASTGAVASRVSSV
jgi:hypothetical protein